MSQQRAASLRIRVTGWLARVGADPVLEVTAMFPSDCLQSAAQSSGLAPVRQLISEYIRGRWAMVKTDFTLEV